MRKIRHRDKLYKRRTRIKGKIEEDRRLEWEKWWDNIFGCISEEKDTRE